MLMLVTPETSFAPRTDSAGIRRLRSGDVMRLGADRLAAEIVLGFRPGIDKLVIVAGARPSGHKGLLRSEEHSDVVLIDAQGRRIVLHGIALRDLKPGDIEITA